MKLKLCLNTSTIRPVKSIIEKIQIAIESGFEGIELWHDDLTAYEKQGMELFSICFNRIRSPPSCFLEIF